MWVGPLGNFPSRLAFSDAKLRSFSSRSFSSSSAEELSKFSRSGDSWFSRESTGDDTHVQLLLSLIVVVSEVFFGLFFLIRLICFGALFFCWRTFRPRKYGWDSRRFKCFLATCKQTDVIWWLKMARANSRVLCHLKIYPDISSNCNIAGTHLRRLETYEKKFSRHFPHTLS